MSTLQILMISENLLIKDSISLLFFAGGKLAVNEYTALCKDQLIVISSKAIDGILITGGYKESIRVNEGEKGSGTESEHQVYVVHDCTSAKKDKCQHES